MRKREPRASASHSNRQASAKRAKTVISHTVRKKILPLMAEMDMMQRETEEVLRRRKTTASANSSNKEKLALTKIAGSHIKTRRSRRNNKPHKGKSIREWTSVVPDLMDVVENSEMKVIKK